MLPSRYPVQCHRNTLYPGQDAPVIATSWRVRLKLNGADDPRLRQFVNQFRIPELSPLSGNRCVGGVGRPET